MRLKPSGYAHKLLTTSFKKYLAGILKITSFSLHYLISVFWRCTKFHYCSMNLTHLSVSQNVIHSRSIPRPQEVLPLYLQSYLLVETHLATFFATPASLKRSYQVYNLPLHHLSNNFSPFGHRIVLLEIVHSYLTFFVQLTVLE